jgi:hypothetical protein
MERFIRVEVTSGDALLVDADILALKYAQDFYGVDKQVARKLLGAGQLDITPRVGGFRLVDSGGIITANRVLFVGGPRSV